MGDKKRVLSFGGGVQTTALALMLERGDVLPGAERPDVAIFADTGAEPRHVYETIEWLRERVSYPVLVERAQGDLERDVRDQLAGVSNWRHKSPRPDQCDLPVFGVRGGMVQRQCTTAYKVDVIKRGICGFYGKPATAFRAGEVVQYIGISWDEAIRMKDSRVQYIRNSWPLVDGRWTRSGCWEWLEEEYPGHPAGRSACYFCPFHSVGEWRELKRRYPELWERSLDLDGVLRGAGMTLFKPGVQSAVELQGDFGEGWGNECEGHCGV